MYQLYIMPGACSLAIHTLLEDMDVPFELIAKADTPDYETVNPLGTVPVLKDAGLTLREGASIALHLASKHETSLLPKSGDARSRAVDALMFANATVHPAYSRMFIASRAFEDETVKAAALEVAAAQLGRLWTHIDTVLETQKYLAGDELTIADVMLTVYANWGQFFPVDVPLGANAKRLIADVNAHPAFKAALAREGVEYKAAA
ncbi:MAG: glutathione S-transferase family protein [Alphaproteobacteria bacterium]|nr:glutathione S-transferase family protein [Alphaproteobacteria bacterium]